MTDVIGLFNRRISSSGTKVTLTGTTAETVMATVSLINIPSNSLLRATYQFSNNNSANQKSASLRLGAVGSGLTGTVFGFTGNTTQLSRLEQRCIFNRGATQIGFSGGTGGWGPSSGAAPSSSQNLVTGADLVITGQLANAGDTLDLEWYLIEVIQLS